MLAAGLKSQVGAVRGRGVDQDVAMSTPPDPLDEAALDLRLRALEDAGVRLVVGSVVNASGLTLAKGVPVERLRAFCEAGMGAAPVWDVFTLDGGIAFTDAITAVGDRRLRIDPRALRVFAPGRAWAPATIHEQDGTPAGACTRSLLQTVERRLADAGLTALVGHELELVLVQPDGSPLVGSAWTPYGLTGLLDQSELVEDLVTSAAAAGLGLEQVHAEYGRNQFEFSLPPAGPVEAADRVVLAKIVVGTVARRHGFRASFSPVPFAGSVGNGAHQHVSLSRDGVPLFAGGPGPHGLTDEGGAAIGGIVGGLADVQGFLTGSVLSGSRLAPGSWSGAFVGWGRENRETAVRFLAGGPANPHGANVEVKIIDPSANVYLASAAVLALALDGVSSGATLPAETAADPSQLSAAERRAAGLQLLSADPRQIIDTLDASALARRLLGDPVVGVTVAVRRLEQATFADVEPAELAERLRLTWSV